MTATQKLYSLISPCRLCPHRCGALRNTGQTGLCGGRALGSVALHTVHHGEEPPISGSRGSGTIFFNGCSLGCVFCQNHQISAPDRSTLTAQEIDDTLLAERMLELASRGVHNINFVTPTHFAPQVASAIGLARERGLTLPIVYNTSGFDTLEVIGLLDGLIDIYMPDVKWLSAQSGRCIAGNDRYHEHILDAVQAMFDQVGPLVLDDEGIARSGLLLRHLVLPGGLSDSMEVLERLSPLITAGAGVSLMAQYHPHGDVPAPLDRTLTPDEYYSLAWELRAMEPAICFIQDLEAHGIFNPDFTLPDDDVFR